MSRTVFEYGRGSNKGRDDVGSDSMRKREQHIAEDVSPSEGHSHAEDSRVPSNRKVEELGNCDDAALGPACGSSWSYVYVPGAGDDEESWADGLTPALFWEHHLVGLIRAASSCSFMLIVSHHKLVLTISCEMGCFLIH
jgi:hypothetical protein